MKFLVPVDFSSCSIDAASYASALAESCKGHVTLMHVIVPVIVSPGMQGVMADERIERMNESLTELKGLIDQLKGEFPHVSYTFHLAEGETTESIIRIVHEQKPDCVVMGTLGATGFKKAFFGSNAVRVLIAADVPVITVPPDTKPVVPEKIVCATDFRTNELDSLQRLNDFAKKVGSRQIHFVHIIGRLEDENEQKKAAKEFMDEIRSIIDFKNMDASIFRSDEVTDGMTGYTEAIGGNLLVLTRHQRGNLERWFSVSVSEELAGRNILPMLVFREQESVESTEF